MLSIILGLLPSFFHVRIRRLMGQKIGKGTKLRLGSFLLAEDVIIEDGCSIGPICIIRADTLKIGSFTTIRPLTITAASNIELGSYVQIAPICICNGDFSINSRLKVGDHSRIFPFCWIDTGYGVEIGQQVGIGGHTLIFTHGVWANYVDGGPISKGPVKIEDNVWLPWRVFILPNVTIGKNVVVGGNSLINKSIEANSLVAGSPAKKIKDYRFNLSPDEKKARMIEILIDFQTNQQIETNRDVSFDVDAIRVNDITITTDLTKISSRSDLFIDFQSTENPPKSSYLNYNKLTINIESENTIIEDFITFLRNYGVRLYVNYINK